jgi:SNF2 family DNA or RNA helicase
VVEETVVSVGSTSILHKSTVQGQIAKDAIFEGPYWPEPVRVLSAETRNRRIEIHAVGLHTERYFSDLLDVAEFEANVQVTTHGLAPTFTASPRHFRLAVEAHRIRLAHEYDPHFAVSVSQIDPLPHQLEAVYHYMLRHPRVRFLLADDPGTGKTIMAGLLLKELEYRGIVERTLVVTPANLTDQWQWARRPLAACRAAGFTALVDAPDDPAERERLEKLIATIVDWDQGLVGSKERVVSQVQQRPLPGVGGS